MAAVHVVRETPVQVSPRVLQMSAMFDVPPQDKALLVGPSGSGKSSIAATVWPDRLVTDQQWSPDAAVIDGFPTSMGIRKVTGLLTSVGFGSPPAWMRPFRCLSNGEQFRVTMARALADMDGLIVVDEFTSVVDRQVAKVASHTVQKTVRRAGRQLVAVTCHYDVIDWLQPDWVYDVAAGEFTWRWVQRHPDLELKVHQTDRSLWPLFRHHHYLSGDLHVAARCFAAFIGDDPVAFTSYIHFPHPHTRNIKTGHRLVVLPDYQGLGIAGRLDDWLGQWLYERRFRYRNTVAHPAMVRFYANSPRWREIGAVADRRITQPSVNSNKGMARRQLKARRLGLRTFEYAPAAA
jgi:ABC-type lipoprotein export system ATPase subunit